MNESQSQYGGVGQTSMVHLSPSLKDPSVLRMDQSNSDFPYNDDMNIIRSNSLGNNKEDLGQGKDEIVIRLNSVKKAHRTQTDSDFEQDSGNNLQHLQTTVKKDKKRENETNQFIYTEPHSPSGTEKPFGWSRSSSRELASNREITPANLHFD